MKRQLPNLITLTNLFCGLCSILLWLAGDYDKAIIFIIIAALADFLDGFVARLLKVSSDVGKELDSLCDLVSFGVFPSIIIYKMLGSGEQLYGVLDVYALPAFTIAMGAAYRLAKFNVDTRQTEDFIGLNTPSMTIFVLGIHFIAVNNTLGLTKLVSEPYFLYGICILLPLLMNMELRLFGLKIKNFAIKGNELKLAIISIGAILLIWLGFQSLSLIILCYILLSLVFYNKKAN